MFSEKVTVLKSWHLKVIFSVSCLLIMISFYRGCIQKPNPSIHTRDFAINLADILKHEICPSHYQPGSPCETMNVQQEADLGFVAYIYIYGVTDSAQIKKIANTSTAFWINQDTRIVVDMTFYKDLDKTQVVKHLVFGGK